MQILNKVPPVAGRMLLVECLCLIGIGLAGWLSHISSYPVQLVMAGTFLALVGTFVGVAVGLLGDMTWPGQEWTLATGGSLAFAGIYAMGAMIRNDHYWYDGLSLHFFSGMVTAWIAAFLMARFAQRVTRGTQPSCGTASCQ